MNKRNENADTVEDTGSAFHRLCARKLATSAARGIAYKRDIVCKLIQVREFLTTKLYVKHCF